MEELETKVALIQLKDLLEVEVEIQILMAVMLVEAEAELLK
jgi:hypothetical protein